MLAVYAVCVWPANIYQAFWHVHVWPLPDSWWYHGPRLALQPYMTLLEMAYPLDDFVIAVKRRDTALRSEASNAVDGAEAAPESGSGGSVVIVAVMATFSGIGTGAPSLSEVVFTGP